MLTLRLLGLVGAVTLALAMGVRPGAAMVIYPWCVQYGGITSSTQNCGFTSFNQCLRQPPGAAARRAFPTRGTRRSRRRRAIGRRSGDKDRIVPYRTDWRARTHGAMAFIHQEELQGRTMAQGRTIDVERLVDDQQITSFNWMLVITCFFVTLIDGYDTSALPAAGPFFVREWHLASPAALTFPFSATNFGVLFGAPLFGWIGDRFGRKPAIILSLVTFGLFTVVVALARIRPGI